MKHRFLITALASVMLAGTGFTAIIPTQNVQAISKKSCNQPRLQKSNSY